MPTQTCTEYIPGEEPHTWTEDTPSVEVPSEVAPADDPGQALATVDVAALDAATTRAKAATTITGLRAAVLDIAAAITPT